MHCSCCACKALAKILIKRTSMVHKKDDCQSITPRENILWIILVNLVMVYTLTNFKDKHGKKKNSQYSRIYIWNIEILTLAQSRRQSVYKRGVEHNPSLSFLSRQYKWDHHGLGLKQQMSFHGSSTDRVLQ
jgi:hypothetical protein